jgi:hypothetical protein
MSDGERGGPGPGGRRRAGVALRRLAAALLLVACGATPASAQDDEVALADRSPALALLLSMALGGGGHYAGATGYLGLGATLQLRTGGFVTGGTAEGGLYVRGYGSTYAGGFAGFIHDVRPTLRLEATAEVGRHTFTDVGDEFMVAHPVGRSSFHLTYLGLRAGALAGVPAVTPRLVFGLYLTYREDLERRRVQVEVVDLAGQHTVNTFTLGGTDFTVSGRIGMEF